MSQTTPTPTPSLGRLLLDAEAARKNRYDDSVGYIRAVLAYLDATDDDSIYRIHRAYAAQKAQAFFIGTMLGALILPFVLFVLQWAYR